MSYNSKRGRNIVNLSERGIQRNEKIDLITDAEYYLWLGRDAIKLLRRGSSFSSVCQAFILSAEEVVFALHFARSSSALQLKALIEEWNWLRIKVALIPATFVQGG